jgi:hypothetical protein
MTGPGNRLSLIAVRYVLAVGSAVTACILIAAAQPAAASPARLQPARVRPASSPTWAGYVAAPPKGQTFKNVLVTFTVPRVRCSGSVGPPAKSKAFPGWHASLWAGIDGWSPAGRVTNGTVQQDGIIAFCRTRKAVAFYRAFYEMFPAGPVVKGAVRAGDRINALVSVSGKTYAFAVDDLTTRKTLVSATARCARHTRCRNATAEVITEAPGGGPDAGHGLADTGTVKYTYAAAGLSGQPPFEDAIPLGHYAALTRLTLSPRKYPRIVRTGKFRHGPDGLTNFDTYWK